MGLSFLGYAYAKPELIIVGEHHFDPRFRQAFNEIVRSDGAVNCIFLEDSPEMDAAAQAYLAGRGSFEETYLRRYYEVAADMGLSREVAQRIWERNYAGRELVLRTAKERGMQVYHADYTSAESRGTVRLNGDDTIEWNYIRRHEIMARNIAARASSCQRSMYLVGEGHLDFTRTIELQQRYRDYCYRGAPIRSVEDHLEEAGFNALAATILLNPSQDEKLSIVDVPNLGEAELDSLPELELKTSNHYYVEHSIRANLREHFDRIYVFA